MKKIAVITGTRAEFGFLQPLLHQIVASRQFELQLIVTGTHLSPEFGYTMNEIQQQGFIINKKIEILLSSESAVGTAKAMGLLNISLAEAFSELQPDLVVITGDRFEMLAAAQVALVSHIPIAHYAGGDITEGAFDDAIRHAITKLASVHFVTNELAYKRVIQMGENPEFVRNVGSLNIDAIQQTPLLSKEQLEESMSYTFRRRNVLITYHPETNERQISTDEQIARVLRALDQLPDEIGLIFTLPNADNEGRIIIEAIKQFCHHHSHAVWYPSLGHIRYLSALREVDVMVGNSSSSSYEAPYFKLPVVNIGNRQKGRLFPETTFHVSHRQEEIYDAIKQALELKNTAFTSPYGDGTSAQQIVAFLENMTDWERLLRKQFYSITTV